MCEIVCVTQSTLCGENFLTQLEKICISGIDRVILREKQLAESDYLKLAEKAVKICKKYDVPLTLHNFIETAVKLNTESFHCSYNMLKSGTIPNNIKYIGVSVHSEKEAVDAEKSGASYITAGHIFETDCKKGLPPKGVSFIENICKSVSIPVYAIGGISPQNIHLLKNTGIRGVCLMSSLMTACSPAEYIKQCRDAVPNPASLLKKA